MQYGEEQRATKGLPINVTVEEEQEIVGVVEATEEGEEEPVPDISWPVAGDGWFRAPKEIAAEVVKISETKSRLCILSMLMLGMLAGVYVGFGAELCTMVTHDLSQHLGIGFTRFLGGSVFSVGLVLVILAGSELFTGNCLILMGVLSGKVTINAMLRNWCFVYFANFAGSLLLVSIVYHSGLWEIGNFGVSGAALATAVEKVNLSFTEAFCRGIGCNWLVCLAVWLAVAGKDSISKILGIYFPIMAFVAVGFEHSIANMFFVPMGLLLKGNSVVLTASGLTEVLGDLTWLNFLTRNLVPVTLGNIVGGAFFVGGIYYLVYLRGGSTMSEKAVMEVLERAAQYNQFIAELTEHGSKALEGYDLSSQEKAALISGDIQWIEKRVGSLTETQKTWLNCRLQQERW